MKFLLRLAIPETEKEVRKAFVEPKNLKHAEQLKSGTGEDHLRVEAQGSENLLIKIMEAVYKLHAFFAPTSGQSRTLERDFLDIADAYTHEVIISEWINSSDKEKRDAATRIKAEGIKRKLEISQKLRELRQKHPD
jgi:hypothetical protein